jgi:hypothetical protein
MQAAGINNSWRFRFAETGQDIPDANRIERAAAAQPTYLIQPEQAFPRGKIQLCTIFGTLE